MNKPVWLLAASLCLAEARGPTAEEAAVRYEYAGGWARCGPAPAEGEEWPTFHRPCGVAVGRDGWVYVVDQGNGRIQYFKPLVKRVGK